MDQTLIEAWAREAGDAETDARGRTTYSFDSYGLARFAALVRAHAREEASAMVRNDAWAISFQTMGQYRSALLRALATPK